jgi:hypothetical protein
MSGKIIQYEVKTDILTCEDDAFFSKDTPFIAVYNTAIAIGSPVIVKAGKNARWYLKGKGRPIDKIKKYIENRRGKTREGYELWLIEL